MQSEATESFDIYKLWSWFELNKKQLLRGTVAVVVVGFVLGFLVWRKGEKEAAAGNAISLVETKEFFARTSRANLSKEYFQVAAEHAGSGAAARAMLFGATGLYLQGQYPEAKDQFQRFLREVGDDSPLRSQALLGVASSLDALGKTSDALAAYKVVADHFSGDPAATQAKFALGRIYEAQSLPDQARTAFEDVYRNNPYGSIGSEAGMRLLELEQKFPQNAAPVAATVPVSKTVTSAPPVAVKPAALPAQRAPVVGGTTNTKK